MPRDVAHTPGLCTGKTLYPTANAAAKARKAIERRKNAKPVKLHQFKCERCAGWHLGNPLYGSTKERRELHRRFLRRHSSA